MEKRKFSAPSLKRLPAVVAEKNARGEGKRGGKKAGKGGEKRRIVREKD